MEFLKHLVSPQIVGDNIPIVCNQENFLLKANSYRISQVIPGFHCIINPANKDALDRGRPSNGMFIAIPDSIKGSVKDVSPNHFRVQAVLISSSRSKTLLINTYLPWDTRTAIESDDLTETLEVIKSVIENNDCDAVVWAGDVNSDFSRDTAHTRAVKDAVENLNLLVTWESFPVDFTCTSERDGNTIISILDHFLISEQLTDTIQDAGVIHHIENTSDHEPIYCVLSSLTLSSVSIQGATPESRPSWKKASLEEKNLHELTLNNKLEAIMVPTQLSECKDLHCRREEHIDAVNWFTLEIMEAIQSAGEETLPFPTAGNKGRKATPGFNDQVRPFKETSLFWHQVWKSAGCPLNTELHKIMKKTRNVYHYEYKKCVRAEAKIKKSKLLDACINGNGDLFKEVKSMRKVTPKVADTMDGVKEDIPNHFGNIYKELYNCVDDGEEVVKICEDIEAMINVESFEDVMRVTPEEVKKATA